MALYTVTPDTNLVPAGRFNATNPTELGPQVAAHYRRHRHLNRGLGFEFGLSPDQSRGVIRQAGLPKPLTFAIQKEC